MGTWGVGLLMDDMACDVYHGYMNRFDDGAAHDTIRADFERDFADAIEDSDDGPIFWCALAKAQWECGVLQTDVLARVEEIVTTGQGLELWEEADLNKRKQVLNRLLTTLRTPKPKPRGRRKSRFTPAQYEPGDCLAITLPHGDYGAALVLAIDNTQRTEGLTLVGVLAYKSPEKPGGDIFEGRRWLAPTHHSHSGTRPEIHWASAREHKKHATELEVVGRIALTENDPMECGVYSGWNLGLQVMMQDKWDRGDRS